MNPNVCIYKITNLVNKKIYIGQTINGISKRWNSHLHKTGCRFLHNAILKYGKENFKIEPIEYCEESELDEKEVYWISYYHSTDRNIGYNILKGGNNGRKGLYKLSSEEIQEIVKLESQGISHIEIGKKFNINRKTVTFILKREYEYKNKRVSLEERGDKEQIINYIKTSNPRAKDVREKFKIGNSTLFRIAKEIGYKFPTYRERQKLGI